MGSERGSDEPSCEQRFMLAMEELRAPFNINGRFVDGAYWYRLEVNGRLYESGDFRNTMVSALAEMLK